MKKGRVGFTSFNTKQVKALSRGADISNVEFIEAKDPSSSSDRPHSEVDTSEVISTDVVGPSSNSVAVGPSSSDPSNDDRSSFFPVHCFCWWDRKHVYFVNTVGHPREVTTVVRTQRDGSNVTYPCPVAVDLYNKYMGGVDLADAMRKTYSCTRKSKNKWYMRLFWFIVDTCVVNAYVLERESPNHRPHPNVSAGSTLGYRSQLNFTLELAQQLVETHSLCKALGRVPIAPPPPQARSESFDRYNEHVPSDLEKPRNCKVCMEAKTKRKRTKYECAKCRVALCVTPCFGKYHSPDSGSR